MCGIAGLITCTGSIRSEVAAVFLERLRHRGPDDYGWLALNRYRLEYGREPRFDWSPEALLVHRRLSILDLSEAGWQPMQSADSRYWIVFNGEIYNYLELRAELEAHGTHFRSHSDTEVLLQAIQRWGADALPKLTGMFAFGVLDTLERKLFLARDAFGIKPLYFSVWDGGFAFASEQKALLELPQVSRRVNPQRVYDYLRFGLTDHGSDTMLEAVHSLPPAHWMEVSLETARPTTPSRYWSLNLEEPSSLSFDQAAERLRELFFESVRLHLRSDVPVGAALSGGIDSSAIVMAMRSLEPKLELHTFSYVADDSKLSEEGWADLVGKAAGATMHKTRAQPTDLTGDLERLLDTQDEPFGSTSIYAQHRVFGLAREAGIKVMLDGQGADEMLGGYHTFTAARLASLVRQGKLAQALEFARRASSVPGRSKLWLWAGEFLVPPAMQGPVRRLVGQELVPGWLNAEWFASREVRTQPMKYTFGDSREVLREQLHRALSHSSLPMLLRYEDRNSMAHSIESRVPFLTPQLAQFVLSLPESYLINRDGQTKAVFRRAMRGIVPDAILDRRDKIGFATPERAWLLELRPLVERTLGSEVAASIGALSVDGLRAEWTAILENRRAFDFRVWRWVNLIEWAGRTGAVFA
jgi:asparagine synthase (glutamine-hydrolysing)